MNTDLKFPSPELKKLLGKIYDSMRGELRKTLVPATYKERRLDFIFHMTDWLSDLDQINDLYRHPEKAKVDDACVTIIGILIHIIPHLNTAGRLLLDEISDPFALDHADTPRERKNITKVHMRKHKPKSKAG